MKRILLLATLLSMGCSASRITDVSKSTTQIASNDAIPITTCLVPVTVAVYAKDGTVHYIVEWLYVACTLPVSLTPPNNNNYK